MADELRCFVLLREGDCETGHLPVPFITLHRLTRQLAERAAKALTLPFDFTMLAVESECDCRGRMVLEGNITGVPV